MNQFVMAGLKVGILTDDDLILSHMESFRENFEGEPCFTFDITAVDQIEGCKENDQNISGVTWHVDEHGSLHGFLYNSLTKQPTARMFVDSTWDKVAFHYVGDLNQRSHEVDRLLSVAFYYASTLHGGLGIHASAVELNGKGILFTAPSETGKTTQANLWEQYKGARIINVDRPLLRLEEGMVQVCGIPWSGSQRIYRNQCSPVAAIVILEQKSENAIRRCTRAEALRRLIPRCFLPYIDKSLVEQAFHNLEVVIDSIPIYVLGCKPNQEAVELVYETIF